MEKWEKKKLKRVRYGLLIIIFCMVPFSLNKYIPIRDIIPEKISGLGESIISPEKPDGFIKKVPKEKSTKETIVQEERLVIPEKMTLPPICFDSISPLTEDILSLELHAMLDNDQTGKLKVVKQFHIPPVDYSFNPKSLILPGCLIAIGSIVSQTDHKDFFKISRPQKEVKQYYYDDYLQYMIAPSLFVLDAVGDEKHHPIDQFFITTIAYGLTALQVRNLKDWVGETRPDGGNNSFPSGHTAVAIVGAHIIYKEFKDTNPWIAYSGYVAVGAVAAGRIINNRHWVCDLAAGAGFGILSTELAYWIYFPIRNAITNQMNKTFGKYIIVTPVASPGGLAIQTNICF